MLTTRARPPAHARLRERKIIAATVAARSGLSVQVARRQLRGDERPSQRLIAAVVDLLGEPAEAADQLFPDPVLAAIQAVVAVAPPLSAEQRARLRALLAGP